MPARLIALTLPGCSRTRLLVERVLRYQMPGNSRHLVWLVYST